MKFEEKRKKEEKNEDEVLTNCDHNRLLDHSSFGVLCLSSG